MTFTTMIKEEIVAYDFNKIEALTTLKALFLYDAAISKKEITFTIENAKVAKLVYIFVKKLFNVNPSIIVRNQKRFRIKQLYIIKIMEKNQDIINTLNTTNLDSDEEKIAYLMGTFLACGSINDPKKGSYHLEFLLPMKKEAMIITGLLKEYNILSKIIKRTNKYMVYIKSAEMISDFLKLIKVTNSLFYYEDIRIYRDHKNMVNRLNNCELANQEKTTQNGLKQLDDIIYLEENDLIDLLDEKTKVVMDYRKKYPESSYQELADIISLETDYKISKSGVNHHFIKLRDLIKRHEKSLNKED